MNDYLIILLRVYYTTGLKKMLLFKLIFHSFIETVDSSVILYLTNLKKCIVL